MNKIKGRENNEKRTAQRHLSKLILRVTALITLCIFTFIQSDVVWAFDLSKWKVHSGQAKAAPYLHKTFSPLPAIPQMPAGAKIKKKSKPPVFTFTFKFKGSQLKAYRFPGNLKPATDKKRIKTKRIIEKDKKKAQLIRTFKASLRPGSKPRPAQFKGKNKEKGDLTSRNEIKKIVTAIQEEIAQALSIARDKIDKEKADEAAVPTAEEAIIVSAEEEKPAEMELAPEEEILSNQKEAIAPAEKKILTEEERTVQVKLIESVEKIAAWMKDRSDLAINCAANSLTALLNFLGTKVSKEEIAATTILIDTFLGILEPGSNGPISTSLYALIKTAASKDTPLYAIQTNFAQLKEIQGPVIAHLGGNHYVVVTAAGNDEVTVVDNGKKIKLSKEDFTSGWQGYILTSRMPDQGEFEVLSLEETKKIKGAAVEVESSQEKTTSSAEEEKPAQPKLIKGKDGNYYDFFGNVYKEKDGKIQPYQGVFSNKDGEKRIIEGFQTVQVVSKDSAEGKVYNKGQYVDKEGELVPYPKSYFDSTSGFSLFLDENHKIILALDKSANIYRPDKEGKLALYFGKFSNDENGSDYFVSNFKTVSMFSNNGNVYRQKDGRLQACKGIFVDTKGDRQIIENFQASQVISKGKVCKIKNDKLVPYQGRYTDSKSGLTYTFDSNNKLILALDKNGNIYKLNEKDELVPCFGQFKGEEEGDVYTINHSKTIQLKKANGNIYKMKLTDGELAPYSGSFKDEEGNTYIVEKFQTVQINKTNGNVYKLNERQELVPYSGTFAGENGDSHIIKDFKTIQIDKANGNVYKLNAKGKLAPYQGTFTQKDGTKYVIEEFRLTQVIYPDGRVAHYKRINSKDVIDKMITVDGQVTRYHYQENTTKLDYVEYPNGNIYKENARGELVPYQGTFLTAQGEEVVLENGEAKEIKKVTGAETAGIWAEASKEELEAGEEENLPVANRAVNKVEKFLNQFVNSSTVERGILLSTLGLAGSKEIFSNLETTKIVAGLKEKGSLVINCAANSLTTLLNFLGVEVNKEDIAATTILIDTLLGVFEPGSAGPISSSLYAMIKTAASKDIQLYGAQTKFAQLKEIQEPVIAHVGGNHYVVVTAATEDEVTVIDNGKEIKISRGNFISEWEGYILTTQAPTEEEFEILTPEQVKEIKGAFGWGSFGSSSRSSFSFSRPSRSFSAVSKPSYSAPKASYSAPKASYSKPSYSAPKVSYSAPKVSYSKPSYSAPKVSYSAPKVSYSKPSYSAPKVSYSAPKVSYAAPKLSYALSKPKSMTFPTKPKSSYSVPQTKKLSYALSKPKSMTFPTKPKSSYSVPQTKKLSYALSKPKSMTFPTKPKSSYSVPQVRKPAYSASKLIRQPFSSLQTPGQQTSISLHKLSQQTVTPLKAPVFEKPQRSFTASLGPTAIHNDSLGMQTGVAARFDFNTFERAGKIGLSAFEKSNRTGLDVFEKPVRVSSAVLMQTQTPPGLEKTVSLNQRQFQETSLLQKPAKLDVSDFKKPVRTNNSPPTLISTQTSLESGKATSLNPGKIQQSQETGLFQKTAKVTDNSFEKSVRSEVTFEKPVRNEVAFEKPVRTGLSTPREPEAKSPAPTKVSSSPANLSFKKRLQAAFAELSPKERVRAVAEGIITTLGTGSIEMGMAGVVGDIAGSEANRVGETAIEGPTAIHNDSLEMQTGVAARFEKSNRTGLDAFEKPVRASLEKTASLNQKQLQETSLLQKTAKVTDNSFEKPVRSVRSEVTFEKPVRNGEALPEQKSGFSEGGVDSASSGNSAVIQSSPKQGETQQSQETVGFQKPVRPEINIEKPPKTSLSPTQTPAETGTGAEKATGDRVKGPSRGKVQESEREAQGSQEISGFQKPVRPEISIEKPPKKDLSAFFSREPETTPEAPVVQESVSAKRSLSFQEKVQAAFAELSPKEKLFTLVSGGIATLTTGSSVTGAVLTEGLTFGLSELKATEAEVKVKTNLKGQTSIEAPKEAPKSKAALIKEQMGEKSEARKNKISSIFFGEPEGSIESSQEAPATPKEQPQTKVSRTTEKTSRKGAESEKSVDAPKEAPKSKAALIKEQMGEKSEARKNKISSIFFGEPEGSIESSQEAPATPKEQPQKVSPVQKIIDEASSRSKELAAGVGAAVTLATGIPGMGETATTVLILFEQGLKALGLLEEAGAESEASSRVGETAIEGGKPVETPKGTQQSQERSTPRQPAPANIPRSDVEAVKTWVISTLNIAAEKGMDFGKTGIDAGRLLNDYNYAAQLYNDQVYWNSPETQINLLMKDAQGWANFIGGFEGSECAGQAYENRMNFYNNIIANTYEFYNMAYQMGEGSAYVAQQTSPQTVRGWTNSMLNISEQKGIDLGKLGINVERLQKDPGYAYQQYASYNNFISPEFQHYSTMRDWESWRNFVMGAQGGHDVPTAWGGCLEGALGQVDNFYGGILEGDADFWNWVLDQP